MSARTDLLGHLTTDLRAEFRVSDKPPGSGAIFGKGRAFVFVERAGAIPTPHTSGWGHTLAVYLLVAPEDYATAEDELDVLLPEVVAAIESHHYPISTIDRDVFFADNDAQGRHGYRITTTTITSTL